MGVGIRGGGRVGGVGIVGMVYLVVHCLDISLHTVKQFWSSLSFDWNLRGVKGGRWDDGVDWMHPLLQFLLVHGAPRCYQCLTKKWGRERGREKGRISEKKNKSEGKGGRTEAKGREGGRSDSVRCCECKSRNLLSINQDSQSSIRCMLVLVGVVAQYIDGLNLPHGFTLPHRSYI